MNVSNPADLTNPTYWGKRRNSKKLSAFTCRKKPTTALRQILEKVQKNETRPSICEIGCAPGSMLLQMAQLQPEYAYCGLDYSKTGIETTRQVLEMAGVHATLTCEDYFKYLPPKPFDMVVSFGVIEHASDPLEAIRRHAEYVGDGGLVAVSIPNYGTPFVKRMAERVDPTVFDSHNVAIMSPKALEGAMIGAGLTDVAIFCSGKSRLRTTCPQRTFSRMCWRTLAKLWNLFSRILPAGVPWPSALWAIGRKSAN